MICARFTAGPLLLVGKLTNACCKLSGAAVAIRRAGCILLFSSAHDCFRDCQHLNSCISNLAR